MGKALRITLVAVLLCSPVFSGEPKLFGVRGFSVGMSLDAARTRAKQIPAISDSCSNDVPKDSPELRQLHELYDLTGWPEKAYAGYEEKGLVVCTFDGGNGFEFVDGRLARIDYRYDSDDFPEVRDTLVKRYGRPASVETKIYQNAFGAKYKGQVLAWRARGATMMVTQYFLQIDQTQVVIIRNDLWKEYNSRLPKQQPIL